MKTPDPRGFPKQSPMARVCSDARNRKRDGFHDRHWSWDDKKHQQSRTRNKRIAVISQRCDELFA